MSDDKAYAGAGGEGKRYMVLATDGKGCEVLVGFTNRADGSDLVRRVQLHPVWHSPIVIDREASTKA